MEAMASEIGLSVPVLRFLICFLATIPVSFLWRLVPGGPPAKHIYAAASGAALSYLSFGFSSNFHFLVPMLLGYGSMVLYRRRCGIITFLLAFTYLIGCHVYYMSGNAWKEGGIDATGALMVLVLKVISCAMNYNDGLLSEESLSQAQKKYRLLKLPSLTEYIGYCLCCGTHFAGPVFEMKDYLEWTEEQGIWARSEKRVSPSPHGATFKALVQAALCMVLYFYLIPKFPLSRFTEPVYQEWGFWKKLGYLYGCTCVDLLHGGNIILSGRYPKLLWLSLAWVSSVGRIRLHQSHDGIVRRMLIFWELNLPRLELKYHLYGTYKLAPGYDIVIFIHSKIFRTSSSGFQLSAAVLHTYLGVKSSNSLVGKESYVRNVYERLIQKGKKPGFVQLLATQTLSAIWHGLYPGYIIFFAHTAVMIAASRVIYRWQQAVSSSAGLMKHILAFLNFSHTILVLGYSCSGFMVLSLHETIIAYRSVYFIGTIVPVVFILLGFVIKPARPSRSKAQKQQ